MNIREMRETYHVEIATIENHPVWVKAKARAIDLDHELILAEKLDTLMKYYKKQHGFAGASSNNIYWNLTRVPLRVMFVPTPENPTLGKRHITLVNPQLLTLAGKEYDNVEACGSIPDDNYTVKRKPHVLLGGFTLEKNYIELEYGSIDYDAGQTPVLSSYKNKEWIVQHEMDHLDGITIKDKGILFDFNSLVL